MVSCQALSFFGSVIMVNKVNQIKLFVKLAFCALSFLLIFGCLSVTEHEMAFQAGVHIISSENFSTIASIPGVRGARSILLYPENIFIVSTEGIIYRYDSETFELLGEYQIAAPSPAGFTEIILCHNKNTAYLIGPFGKILEISLPECTVVDEFSVCESPIKLALGPQADYLFVADGVTSKIYQVRVSDNKVCNNISVYFSINCMEPAQDPNFMLVGTSNGVSLIEVLGPTEVRLTEIYDMAPFNALAAIPNDTLFVGVAAGELGMVNPWVYLTWPPGPFFYQNVSVSGDTYFVAVGSDWKHAYLLSYLGDNTSSLISYNYLSYKIEQTTDIPGYPLGFEVAGSGNIYVLTTE